MPAAWLQSVNPLFIIAFAPVLAALWISLGKRGRDLNAAAKFGAGLLLLGLGFIVMYFASQYVLAGQTVSPLGWCSLTCCIPSASCACRP